MCVGRVTCAASAACSLPAAFERFTFPEIHKYVFVLTQTQAPTTHTHTLNPYITIRVPSSSSSSLLYLADIEIQSAAREIRTRNNADSLYTSEIRRHTVIGPRDSL